MLCKSYTKNNAKNGYGYKTEVIYDTKPNYQQNCCIAIVLPKNRKVTTFWWVNVGSDGQNLRHISK